MSDLIERATEEPASVTDEEIAELLDTAMEGPDTNAIGALEAVTAEEPGRVDRVVAALADRLEPGRPAEQLQVALEIAESLGHEHPERTAVLAPAVFDLLEGQESRVETAAARALGGMAPAVAETTAERRGAVADLLGSEELIGRAVGAQLVAALAEADPDAAAGLLDEMLALVGTTYNVTAEEVDQTALDSDAARQRFEEMLEEEREERSVHDSARREVATAVALVAESHPDAVADHVDDIAAAIEESDVPGVRYALVDALVPVAESSPAAAMAALDALVGRLEAGGLPENLARVARVLGFLADADERRVADAVRPHLDTVLGLLEEEDPGVRGATAGLLMYVGEQYPEDVAEGEEALLELLDAEDPSVRGSAALVLGAVGGSDARERLSAVAAADPSEEVRAAAGQAAQRIDAS